MCSRCIIGACLINAGALLQLPASALLLFLSAVGLRHHVGAGRARPPWWVLALDGGPLLLGAVVFGGITARPLLGAAIVAAIAAGLAGGDLAKQHALNEPVVFADRAELPELLRHPEFFIPFAGTALVACSIVAGLLAFALLLWALPPLWQWSPWVALLAAASGVLAFKLPAWPPLLAWLHRHYASLAPTHDPAQDSARWGMLATFVIHATLARAERPGRCAAPSILRLPRTDHAGPVVMAQLESFFDPRRLHPSLPRDMLPALDVCRAESLAWGPLLVPSWGANTVRTEFSALTGIGAATLGLDRFNPYERFARTRLDSIAWRMQALGRRTVCLHPFDPRFYGRNQVMPSLGFQQLVGPEAFGARDRRDAFINDAAVAEMAARIIDENGPELFLFVITIGNHGPWLADRGPEDAAPLPEPLAHLPDALEFRRFLGGARRTDAFLAQMTATLQPQPGSMLLAYGDHQPSLPGLFKAVGHTDARTDYVLWQAGMMHGARPTPLAATALPQTLLDHLASTRQAEAAD